MRKLSRASLSSALALGLIAAATAWADNDEAAFKAAYASADAAEREAGQWRNQWTVTEASLTEARNAAAKGEFDRAIAAARQAEALAKASIFQARDEKQAWKALQIR